jgi:hypothetical protein
VNGPTDRRPTPTATAGSAVVAVGGTLALAAVSGAFSAAALGVVAGGCLAGCAWATAATERRPGTVLGGGIAAAAGVAAFLAGLTAVAAQVQWPPVPPVPYLAFAPFGFVLAGALAGTGALAAVRDVPLASQAPTTGRRTLAVALVPTAVLLVAHLGPTPWRLAAIGAVGLLLAAVARRSRASRPPLVAVLATGLSFVVAAAAARGFVEPVVVGTARTEAGRRYLRAWFELYGTFELVVGVVSGGALLAALALLAVGLAARLRLLGDAATVQLASAGPLVAAVAAALAGVGEAVVIAGVAAGLLTWDLGSFAVALGREVGATAESRRGELTHVAGAVALAGAATAVALLAARLVGAVPVVVRPAAVVGAVAATVGTLVLVTAVR